MITLEAFQQELKSWEKTPYRDSMMVKGHGVDCLRFVVAVADFLHGYDTLALPPVPKLPRQTSEHNEGKCKGVIKWLLRRYPNICTWREDVEGKLRIEPKLKPGDILCMQNKVYPGHALIAGTRAEQGEIWHSISHPAMDTKGFVHQTSLGWAMSEGLLWVWRPTESLLDV